MRGTGIYCSWINMKTRCYNKNSEKYKSYGARGIRVDKKWHTFYGFKEDMLKGWKKGLTIERIDVNKDYTKKNCKWIPKKDQYKNKQEKIACYKGESLSQATKRLGGKKDLVWNRLKKGWTIKQAFTTPLQKNRKQRYLYEQGQRAILTPKEILTRQSK